MKIFGFVNLKSLLCFLTLFLPITLLAQFSAREKKGFAALAVYDYFKARSTFYALLPRPAAAYGLALISHRNDNPFSNADTAVKYSQLALAMFRTHPVKDSASGFLLDEKQLLELLERCATAHFVKANALSTVEAWDQFLAMNSMCSPELREDALALRDRLELQAVKARQGSRYTAQFLKAHPCSPFYREAYLLYEQQLYLENCPNQNLSELRTFLARYPKSSMRQSALSALYERSVQSADTQDLLYFVRQYPEAPQQHEAWKWFFSRNVRSYTEEELLRFLKLYPDFPLRNSILKDLQLSGLYLFPVKWNEQWVYLDTAAMVRIAGAFESAREFSEELAVVSRNDSVWYINKAGEAVFSLVFDEAFSFQSGSAAVKAGGRWFFINRQGQQVSPYYEEINELSENLYVVKTHGLYGALDRYGQSIIPAQFQSLGDFKRGYAVYREGEKYGLVTAHNEVQPARYDWLSDIDENGLVLVRLSQGFGLVNSKGERLLPPDYDQIISLTDGYYLLVKRNSYGFFSKEGCFMTDISYDYPLGKEPGYFYQNGQFRLHKGKQQALMDPNGFLKVPFKAFDELGFFKEALLWVRKKGKIGFVDQKLQYRINPQYTEAGDFEMERCIVKREEGFDLIGTRGERHIEAAISIERIERAFFLVQKEGESSLCDRDGRVLQGGIREIQKPAKDKLLLLLKNDEFKVLKLKT